MQVNGNLFVTQRMIQKKKKTQTQLYKDTKDSHDKPE